MSVAPQTLFEWRRAKGISQAQAGQMFGCSQPFVSNLEDGRWKPGLELALSIERETEGKVKAGTWVEAPSVDPIAASSNSPPPTESEVA